MERLWETADALVVSVVFSAGPIGNIEKFASKAHKIWRYDAKKRIKYGNHEHLCLL